MLTNEQIEAKLNSIDARLKGITVVLDRMNTDIASKTNLTDLNRSVEELRELIRANSILINSLEEKLTSVILPEETRYYLSQGEVATFQSNFNALKAMMNKLDKLSKNIVAYQANLTA